jgi:hypothetical protein
VPSLSPKAALLLAGRYLREHPRVLQHVAINTVRLKVTVPLDLLRYFVAQTAGKKKAPKDVVLEASPPVLKVAASVDLMGTPIRFGAGIKVDEIRLGLEELRIEIRLSEVSLRLEGPSDSPVAALIKSGALDLSKPGNLAKYMPNRPPTLIEAEDDRIVLDLMKDAKIAQNPKVRKILEIIVPVLAIRSFGTEGDALVIALRPKPSGVPTMLQKVRAAVAG